MNKKIIFCCILLSMLCLTTPILAGASLGTSLDKTAEEANISQNQDLTLIIAMIIQTLLGLLGVAFVILLVYGGVIWMTSLGEPKKIETAKNIIKAATIGLVIVITAYSIAYFITVRLESAANLTAFAPSAYSLTKII